MNYNIGDRVVYNAWEELDGMTGIITGIRQPKSGTVYEIEWDNFKGKNRGPSSEPAVNLLPGEDGLDKILRKI